jgi:hypothetical protein
MTTVELAWYLVGVLLAVPLMFIIVAAIYAEYIGVPIEIEVDVLKWTIIIRVTGFRGWFK